MLTQFYDNENKDIVNDNNFNSEVEILSKKLNTDLII